MAGHKKVFKSRGQRFRILKRLEWVPDILMVRLQYALMHHRLPNVKNPVRFTEYLQWYKINHRDPVMTTCVDKVAVREFVRAKGYSDLLTDVYATAASTAGLNLDQLPQKFVLKTNNGSGTNIIVTDKSTLSISELNDLDEWLKRDLFAASREWPYKNVPPMILAEELLEDSNSAFDGIHDYKFFCFGGEPRYIVLDVDRAASHKRNIYTADWENTGAQLTWQNTTEQIPRPERLQEMLKIAADLSRDFPFARVDLYYVQGRIYFGEITFFPGSGYSRYAPDEFDLTLGSLWPARG